MRKLKKSQSLGCRNLQSLSIFLPSQTQQCSTLPKSPAKKSNNKHRSLTFKKPNKSALMIQKQHKNDTKKLSNYLKESRFQMEEKIKNDQPVFIMKMKAQMEKKEGDKNERIMRKIRATDVNFRKINYVDLYATKNKKELGKVVRSINEEMEKVHDFSENFIVSKGKLYLRGSEAESRSSFSEFSRVSSIRSEISINQKYQTQNLEQLILKKKKMTETDFHEELSAFHVQCYLKKRDDIDAKNLYQMNFSQIQLKDETNKPLFIIKLNHATQKKITFPHSILKKNKKRVILKFNRQMQTLYFLFVIKRRYRPQKNKASLYKQKMLIAYENHSYSQFQLFLEKYIGEFLFVSSTVLGRKIVSKEISIENEKQQHYYPLFEHKRVSISSLVSEPHQRSIMVFTAFIQIKNKFFLCKFEVKEEQKFGVVTILYEPDINAKLPHGFIIKERVVGILMRNLRKSKKIVHTIIENSLKMSKFMQKTIGQKIFGLKEEGLENEMTFRLNKNSQKENLQKNISIVENYQSIVETFKYQICDNDDRQPDLSSHESPLKQVKNQKMKSMSNFLENILSQVVKKNNQPNSSRKKIIKTEKKVKIDKNQNNKNFFKIRNSFDYGIRKGPKKSILKSYKDSCYCINIENFSVKGFKKGKRFSLEISKQEQKERLLILNLPYHLDKNLSLKWENFILNKIMEKNKNFESIRFCLKKDLKQTVIFQCFEHPMKPNIIIFKIQESINKKLDFFSFKAPKCKNAQSFMKIGKILAKYPSFTYPKYTTKPPLERILYKKVEKLCQGLYLVFTLVQIPSICLTYLRVYNGQTQISYYIEIRQMNKNQIKEIVRYYKEELSMSYFHDIVQNMKKRVKKKKEETFEKLILTTFRESKSNLLQKNVRKIRSNRMMTKKSTCAYLSNQQIHNKPEIGRQLYTQFYADKFQRVFFISLVKFLNRDNSSSEDIEINIFQAGKKLKYGKFLKYKDFLQKIHCNLKDNNNSHDHISNECFSELMKPLVQIINSDIERRKENILNGLKQLFKNGGKGNQCPPQYIYRNGLPYFFKFQRNNKSKLSLCAFDTSKKKDLTLVENFNDNNLILKILRKKNYRNNKLLQRIVRQF